MALEDADANLDADADTDANTDTDADTDVDTDTDADTDTGADDDDDDADADADVRGVGVSTTLLLCDGDTSCRREGVAGDRLLACWQAGLLRLFQAGREWSGDRAKLVLSQCGPPAPASEPPVPRGETGTRGTGDASAQNPAQCGARRGLQLCSRRAGKAWQRPGKAWQSLASRQGPIPGAAMVTWNACSRCAPHTPRRPAGARSGGPSGCQWLPVGAHRGAKDLSRASEPPKAPLQDLDREVPHRIYLS